MKTFDSKIHQGFIIEAKIPVLNKYNEVKKSTKLWGRKRICRVRFKVKLKDMLSIYRRCYHPPLSEYKSAILLTLTFRDRSSGISGNRVGGPKDSGNLRHSSNRPMSSSPSRMSGEIHNQHRGPGYQQHGGAEGHSASSGNAGVADGVYSNKRLMHACTCLIGTTVQVNFAIGIILVQRRFKCY